MYEVPLIDRIIRGVIIVTAILTIALGIMGGLGLEWAWDGVAITGTVMVVTWVIGIIRRIMEDTMDPPPM